MVAASAASVLAGTEVIGSIHESFNKIAWLRLG
jgi:hypothetical protein